MRNDKTLSPIILFVFNRAFHTQKTIEALAANELAKSSQLYIYADAPRNESEIEAVNEVRKIIKSTQGFSSVTVIERVTNYGLARNIIEGVSEICSRHGRAIVLEDDLVTSPAFLSYMNGALDRYKQDKQVWHISGWNYPMETAELDDAFFIRVMNCWGWATWSDRWQQYEKNTDKIIAEFDSKMIKRFDLEDSGVFWSQILMNKKGSLNTWAIYWYATIFKNNGLCLNPTVSYIENIGLDGSGTHRSKQRKEHSVADLNQQYRLRYPNLIAENLVAINKVTQFYKDLKPTLMNRIIAKLLSTYKRLM